MATTFCPVAFAYEVSDSPDLVADGISSTKTRVFRVKAADEDDALALAKTLAPTTETVDSIPLEAPPRFSCSTDGLFSYLVRAEYKHSGRDKNEGQELIDTGDEVVSGDFSGESIHITTARSQTKYGASAPNTQKGINVQYNGEVEGTDINRRTGAFQVATLIDEATGTNAWFKARFEQVWTFNNATFRSWAAGSVALTGMQYRQRSDKKWEITYSFQIFPNETVSSIGGVSLGGSVTVKGDQYKWVMFRPKEDSGTNTIVPEAIGAYVADVYDPETDFADLGIST